MAAPVTLSESINALNATSKRIHESKVAINQWKQSLPLLMRLNRKGGGIKTTDDGGRRIEIPLTYSGNTTAKFQGEWDNYDDTPQDGITAAFADWSIATAVTTMSGLQKFQNSGMGRIIRLWAEKKQQTMDQLSDITEQALFDVANITFGSSGTATTVGSDGDQLTPLPFMVDYDPDRDTPFQSVNGYDYSWWRPRVKDFSTGSTTEDLYEAMLNLYITLGRTPGGNPDMGFGSYSLYENYIKHLDQKIRYSSNEEATAGFENVRFLGMDLFPTVYMCDPEAGENGSDSSTPTAAALYMLNSKFLKFHVAKGLDFAPQGVKESEKQWAVREPNIFVGQFTTSQRRKQGVLYGVGHTLTASLT